MSPEKPRSWSIVNGFGLDCAFNDMAIGKDEWLKGVVSREQLEVEDVW